MGTIDRKLRASRANKRDFPDGRKPIVARRKPIIATSVETREDEIARLLRTYGTSNNGHALFSPSSSAGWMNCQGFLLANANKIDRAGIDAAYGTVAHAFAAEWLTAIRDHGAKRAERVPKAALNTVHLSDGHEITIDAQMVHHVRRYIDFCAEVERLGDVFIEQRVGYEGYTPIPGQGGTADHFVCVPPRRGAGGKMVERGQLIITDLKMGYLRVDVVRNTQAMLYALGVYLEWNWLYGFGTITIRIAQPRLDSFETWECSDTELLAFGEEVRIAADKAWREDAPRSPSAKACQWCRDVLCPARSNLLADLTDDAFEPDPEVLTGEKTPTYDTVAMAAPPPPLTMAPPPGPEKVDPNRVALAAWRYRHRSFYERYFKEIGEELLRLALTGVEIPGFKVTRGRRSFSWLDPETAAFELSVLGLGEEDIFKSTVTSVNQASTALRVKVGMSPENIEKLLYGDEATKQTGLATVKPGKPMLAPIGDQRTDVKDATDAAFEDDDETM